MVDAPPSSPAPSLRPSSFASMMDDEEGEGEEEDAVLQVDATLQDDSLKLENLGLSPPTVAALRARGITALFPIQKSVFEPIRDGRDLIGRAKTGSGKTLAFALPVIEACLKEDAVTKPRRGRTPRCVVLAPTRELANQVAREFESVSSSLRVISVYGGVSIGGQIRDLERGVDVVVGTPGRVIDLIEREALVLDAVRFAILDEADQMLDMGFEEDMEKILSYVPEERQTLLFSATLPKWVASAARRFQRNPLKVDLVGEANTGKLADTIRLLAVQVEPGQKVNAAVDAIGLHASGGKTIVFVNTKARADELAEQLGAQFPTVVLHGDITQANRDRGLQQFRDNKYPVLVATDVAARGLDIPAVDLVLHYDVPQDNEALLHRSGRTGRAGNRGTAVVLFTEKDARALGSILLQCKVDTAELAGAPEPGEMLARAAKGVLGQLDKVDPRVIDFFVPAAERLLAASGEATSSSNGGGSGAGRVLAAALAALSGFRNVPQPRSLLTYEEGMTTLRLMGPTGAGGIDGFRSLVMALRGVLAKAKVRKDGLDYMLGKVSMQADKPGRLAGAAFDLPAAEAAALMGNPAVLEAATKMGYTLDQPKTLPLNPRDMAATGERGGRFGRGGGGYRSDEDGRRGSGSWGNSRGSRNGRSSGGGARSSSYSSRGGGAGSWRGGSDRAAGPRSSGGSSGSRNGRYSGSGAGSSGAPARDGGWAQW